MPHNHVRIFVFVDGKSKHLLPLFIELLDEEKVLLVNEKAKIVEAAILGGIDQVTSNSSTSYFEIQGDHFHLELHSKGSRGHWPMGILISAVRVSPEPYKVLVPQLIMSFYIMPKRNNLTEIRGRYGHSAVYGSFLMIWGCLEEFTAPRDPAEIEQQERITDLNFALFYEDHIQKGRDNGTLSDLDLDRLNHLRKILDRPRDQSFDQAADTCGESPSTLKSAQRKFEAKGYIKRKPYRSLRP